MKKSHEVKEKIIKITTELINQSNGDVNEVTTRLIAERAGVGVGLINYHFQTKENLIEICVQRMIGNLITNYQFPKTENSLERLKNITKKIFDFCVEYPAISRISILSDLQNPQVKDNTYNGYLGFFNVMGDFSRNENEKLISAFILTSTIHAALLRKNVLKEVLGYDFDKKADRDVFIDFIINIFLNIEGENIK